MKKLYALFLVVLAVSWSFSAKAEVFVWKDPEFRIDFVYPDLWREQFDGNENVRLHVLAPQGRDFASCKVIAKQDKRYMMYPSKYTQRVNSIVFNADNIRQHYVEKHNVSLIARDDYAAIGKSDAVYAEIRFVGRMGPAPVPMQGMMFATLYGDLYFVFECEAAAQNWNYWRPIFLNMAKSIDFPMWQDMHPHGLYPYNFTEEGDILLSTDNAKTGTLKY